jgi:hypothetical protein
LRWRSGRSNTTNIADESAPYSKSAERESPARTKSG